MRRRGLTLIELIVSLFLILLLCIFVLDLFPGSLIGMRHGQAHLEAQRVAEATLEQARAASFDSWVVGTNQTMPAQSQNGMVFQSVLAVQAVPGYNPLTLKNFQVTVTWQERGVAKSLVQGGWVARGN